MLKTIKKGAAAVGLLAMPAYQSVWAALPTPVAPSTAPAAGDWIELIKGYIKDGGLVRGLAIAVLGFCGLRTRFREVQRGTPGQGRVGGGWRARYCRCRGADLRLSLHPTFVILPFATLFALAVAVTASTFKKYI